MVNVFIVEYNLSSTLKTYLFPVIRLYEIAFVVFFCLFLSKGLTPEVFFYYFRYTLYTIDLVSAMNLCRKLYYASIT